VENFHVGDLVEGLVVSVLDFGAFVELTEGLHGLVHISEIGYANAEDPKAVVKKGDPVLVKIMSIDPARERISLSMRRVPISEQMEWIMNLEDAAEGVLLDGDEDLVEEESEKEHPGPEAAPAENDDEVVASELDGNSPTEGKEQNTSEAEEPTAEDPE